MKISVGKVIQTDIEIARRTQKLHNIPSVPFKIYRVVKRITCPTRLGFLGCDINMSFGTQQLLYLQLFSISCLVS